MSYNPTKYIVPSGLEHALKGAVILDQPLLLTGEPGTGKTTLADWAVPYLREKLGVDFHPEVLRFHTKTTSTAQDLFYTYDALGHFQAANLGGKKANIRDFVELQALGKAIAMSNPRPELASLFRTPMPEKPVSTVVLIDEVDKAPRDFTNDILDEIDRKRFFLREQNVTIDKGEAAKIVVIMTSNSEKNLPDAFLRRCAFFHIDFPSREQLREIVRAHMGDANQYANAALNDLLDFFESLRKNAVRKKPATAELIGWLKLLEVGNYVNKPPKMQQALIRENLSFLVKTKEDLQAAQQLVGTAE